MHPISHPYSRSVCFTADICIPNICGRHTLFITVLGERDPHDLITHILWDRYVHTHVVLSLWMHRNQDPDDLVDRDLTNVRTLVDNDDIYEGSQVYVYAVQDPRPTCHLGIASDRSECIESSGMVHGHYDMIAVSNCRCLWYVYKMWGLVEPPGAQLSYFRTWFPFLSKTFSFGILHCARCMAVQHAILSYSRMDQPRVPITLACHHPSSNTQVSLSVLTNNPQHPSRQRWPLEDIRGRCLQCPCNVNRASREGSKTTGERSKARPMEASEVTDGKEQSGRQQRRR